MSAEWITDVRFYDVKKTEKGPVVAGSLTVADALAVRFTMWNSRDGGYRVMLPAKKNEKFQADQETTKTNQPYFDEVFPLSAERRNELTTCLVEAAQKAGKIEGGVARKAAPSADFDALGDISFP